MPDSRSTANGPTDELGLIRWIRGQVPADPRIEIGPGDDCAVLKPPPGERILATTDMLIDGVHFRSEDVAPERIGWKAVARAVSDIAAMAGKPAAVVIAVAVPKGTSPAFAKALFDGMKTAADTVGAAVAGGDISTGAFPLMLTVTVVGFTSKGRCVPRSGAKPGDAVFVTGVLGGAMAGRHLEFTPRIAEALWLADNASLHAMIDISDGLAADANHVAEESGVGIELLESVVPIAEAAREAARSDGRTPLDHALHDGEDYELLFAVSTQDAEKLAERTDAPVAFARIGKVIEGEGLWLIRAGGQRERIDPGGWVHEL